MEYYIGLDVSQRQTAICVVDRNGKTIAEGKVLTLPTDIHGWLTTKIVDGTAIVRVGLEAGAMSAWLYTELSKLGLPMVCLEAFQAHQFLKSNRNKTDKNDARGLAQLVRMGGDFIRPVTIRAQASHESRTLLTLRQKLVKQKVALENAISGSLKPFGLVVPRGKVSSKTFRSRITEVLAKADERGLKLRDAVLPSLDLYDSTCEQIIIGQGRCEYVENAWRFTAPIPFLCPAFPTYSHHHNDKPLSLLKKNKIKKTSCQVRG